MACLLSLPRELRTIIIDEVIASNRDVPQHSHYGMSSSEASPLENRARPPNDGSYRGGIRYLTDPACYVPHLAALLLVNRQFQAETSERLRVTIICYEMDIMLVEERELWPTWTFLPILKRHINTVTMKIRTYGDAGQRTSAFLEGNGGPPIIMRGFEALLSDLINYGPVNLSSRIPNTRRGVTIQHLRLDVLSPTTLPVELGNVPYDVLNPWQPSTKYSGSPKALADFLAKYLKSLLRMSRSNAAYGSMLFESVGEIRISLDGRTMHELTR